MYRLLVETLLGLSLEGDQLRLTPCLPRSGRRSRSTTAIGKRSTTSAVLQTPAETGEMRVTVDGVEQHDKTIPLVDDHMEHKAEVRIPRTVGAPA